MLKVEGSSLIAGGKEGLLSLLSVEEMGKTTGSSLVLELPGK